MNRGRANGTQPGECVASGKTCDTVIVSVSGGNFVIVYGDHPGVAFKQEAEFPDYA